MQFPHVRQLSSVLVLLGCLMAWTEASQANTRLGLHVTSDELTIWQARRTDNTNSSNGVTYQNIYTNRILAKADTFKNSGSHPFASSDGRWNPSFSGCFPNAQSPAPGRHNGDNLLASAFVFLLSGDNNYGEPVRQELLAQIAVASTNFGNGSLWCVTDYAGTAIEIPGWLEHLLFAYDYIRAGGLSTLTNQNKIDIETWFNNAAVYWMLKTDVQANHAFPNRLSDNYSCTGWACPSTEIGTTFFSGNAVNWFHNSWSNQIANAVTFFGAVANLMSPSITLDTRLGPRAKRYFEESIKYAIFPDSTAHEFWRWADGECTEVGPGSAWTHGHFQLGPLASVADHFGRAGDLSLYTYMSNVGLFGTGGTTKGLLDALRRAARMQNGTVNLYGTTSAGNVGNSACLLNGNTQGGHTEDLGGMLANIYYQNSEIHTAMARTLAVASGCGGTNCYGGPWGAYLDLPFQWGNLDSGQINPFAFGADTTPPAAPTGLSVTGIYPTQIQATWTPPGDGDLAGYVMKYCLTASCTPNLTLPTIGLVSTTVITGLVPGTTYRLTLEAVDTSNNHSTPTAVASVATPAQGLIVHYRLDQSSGTTATDIIAGRNGTLCNGASGCGTQGPSWVAGHVGSNALSFDGAASPNNDFVRVANHASLNFLANQDFTVAWWINTTQAATAGVWPDVIAKGDAIAGWGIELHEENFDPIWHVNVRVASTVYPTNGCTNVASAGWKHLAFTRQGTSIRTYEDGVLCQTTTNAALNGTLTNSNAFYWAVDSSETGTAFAGSLDDIRLYNYALSDSEIGALFSGQATLATTHWRFHGYGKSENTEWLAAEDTARMIRQNGYVRVRFGIQNTATISTQGYPVQCKLDNGPYQTIPDSCPTPGVCMADDPAVTNGQMGTVQMTVPGGFTFASGQAKFVDNTTPWPSITLDTNQTGEVEYSLRLINVSAGVVVCCHPVQGDLSAVSAGASGDACLTVNAGSFSYGF